MNSTESSTTNTAYNQIELIHDILKSLRITYKAVQTHSHMIEKGYGLSATQLWAMWELFKTPGLTVSDLAEVLLIHLSTSSNMLDKLEKKNLIRRERVGPDQRVVRLYLTSTGVDFLATAPRPANGLIFEALQNLPSDVLRSLSGYLVNLVDQLKAKN